MQDALPPAATTDLAAVMERLLGLSQCDAGLRLKSERELARSLGVDRMRVRRSVEHLVEKGILVRKHGSGVYVRKAPRLEDTSSGLSEQMDHFASVSLFAETPEETRLRPPSETARLQLGMWGLTESPNESGISILHGMRDHAEKLGHVVTPYPVSELKGASHASKQLGTDFTKYPCDGCIVLIEVAQGFDSAVEGKRPPTVYVATGNVAPDFQPMVQIDGNEAMVRGLKILAKEGFRRIGVIGLDVVEHLQRPVYEEAMKKLGLRYSAMTSCGTGPKDTAQAVRRLFDRKGSPEALYVADDIVMRGVAPALEKSGLIAGKNLGVIVYSNRGNPLPAGADWSCLEMDPYSVGCIAMESLLREIETAGDRLLSFSHQAAWRPGNTHFIARSQK